MRRLVLILFVAMLGCGLRAQTAGYYRWEVTHDSGMTLYLTALEASRAALEKNLATMRGYQGALYNTAIGQEHYQALRNYAKVLRLIRTLRASKDFYKRLVVPAWVLLPKIGVVAPVEYTDENGVQMVQEKEIASLSFVPANMQATWKASDFIQDDETTGAPDVKGGGKSFVNLVYPRSLSDIKVDIAESPLIGDFGWSEEDAIDALMAHTFENILDGAASLAKFGIQVNPQVLADGSKLAAGRLSPDQIRLQASIYQQQALEMLGKMFRLYIDQGMPLNKAERILKYDYDYWNNFTTTVFSRGSARMAFAMNSMLEINQVIGRLESYNRRGKEAETDEKLGNLGKKPKADGSGYEDFQDGGDFWDLIDKGLGYNPYGRATQLQAKGLSARYSHSHFEEAQGLRNIMLGIARIRVASEGISQLQRAEQDLNKMKLETGAMEALTQQLESFQKAKALVNSSGWGAMPMIEIPR